MHISAYLSPVTLFRRMANDEDMTSYVLLLLLLGTVQVVVLRTVLLH